MNHDIAIKIYSVLNIECTRCDIICQSKKKALFIISKLAAKQLSIAPQVVFDAILARERMGSTGIGKGIAIPHGKIIDNIPRTIGVFIRLKQPIAFNAIDNQPVDLIFALLLPFKQKKIHLHTLALIAKYLGDKTVSRRLRSAKSAQELHNIIVEANTCSN